MGATRRDTVRIWRAAAAAAVALGTGYVLVGPPAGAAPVVYDILLTTSNSAGQDVAYTVPGNVCAIAWKVYGGQGGSTTGTFTGGTIIAAGGKGGRVEAVTAVTPGDQFQLQVGEAGTEATMGVPAVAAARSGSIPSGGDAVGTATAAAAPRWSGPCRPARR